MFRHNIIIFRIQKIGSYALGAEQESCLAFSAYIFLFYPGDGNILCQNTLVKLGYFVLFFH